MKKCILIMLGALAAVMLLEGSMRTAGFLADMYNEYRNTRALKSEGTYRILCVGESTTALGGSSSYPRLLNDRLNQSSAEIKFSVINRGVFGDSNRVLSELKENISNYDPDMIIVMMGINDGEHIMEYDEIGRGGLISSIKAFRVYKLVKLLGAHIAARAASPEERSADMSLASAGAGREGSGVHHDEGLQTRLDLFSHYMSDGDFSSAEKVINEAEKLYPENDIVYLRYGWLYACRFEYEKMLASYKKVLEINPQNNIGHLRLAEAYVLSEKYDEAEGALTHALKIFPLDRRLAALYAKLQIVTGDLRHAEDILERALESYPQDILLNRLMGRVYEMSGNISGALIYNNKAAEYDLLYYNTTTRSNHMRAKEIILKNNIRMVCMQYPMRSIEPLQKMLDFSPDIIFVDNDKSFRIAVKRDGYEKYFNDMFAGDFGHCTREGNVLISANIAVAVLNKLFD